MTKTGIYPIQINEWFHEKDFNKTIGHNTNEINYILGITPIGIDEPSCCCFNVTINFIIKNHTQNVLIFQSKTFSCYKVCDIPHVVQPQFYFDLICDATSRFEKLFHERAHQTNLHHTNVQKPIFEDMKDNIQKCIDTWDRLIRNNPLN